MKKQLLITGIMIVTLLALLVGCSNANEDSKDANSATDKEKLIVGIDDAFAPMGFRDENNEIVGFDIDLAKATGEEMGKEVVFQPIDWSSKESELSSGRIRFNLEWLYHYRRKSKKSLTYKALFGQ